MLRAEQFSHCLQVFDFFVIGLHILFFLFIRLVLFVIGFAERQGSHEGNRLKENVVSEGVFEEGLEPLYVAAVLHSAHYGLLIFAPFPLVISGAFGLGVGRGRGEK